MAWTIKYTKTFQKEVRKLDKQIQRKVKLLFDDLAKLDDPRTQGKGLTHNLSGLWRYRIEGWRVICEIQDDELIILTLKIGRRDKVYD